MEYISNDIFEIGVYGIKDTVKNKIVYVGSTHASFARRWGEHLYRYENNTHSNDGLNEMFEKGNYQFCILEICTGLEKREILEKEKLWSDKHETIENGVGVHCGGGKIQKSKARFKEFEETKEIIECKEYIRGNYLDKKINQEQRDEMIKELSDKLKFSDKFMITIKKLGFNINRYADKKHWIITEITKKVS